MRLRAARTLALLQSQQQTLQQAAAQCLGQVSALHSLPGSPAVTQQDHAVLHKGGQQVQQHSHAGQQQDYHAAALADVQVWHSSHHHQQEQHVRPQLQLQQSWHAVRDNVPAAVGVAPTRSHARLMQQQLASSQQAAGSPSPSGSQPSKRSTSSVSSSSASSSSIAPAEAASQLPGDEGDGDSAYGLNNVFQLSSPEQQYKLTLAALHSGRSTNLDQLALMFEPQALLAAPDKGAAVLEALMFAAAKLEDMQLLRQLLRCVGAADHKLTSAGHRAVLHGLASCGRPAEALDWLQRMPEQQLQPQLVRSLVQQLLKQQHVYLAQRALDYAEPKLMQRWQQELQQGMQEAASAELLEAAGTSASAEQPQRLSLEDMQELPSLRLLTAGQTGQLSAVQRQWAAILREAQTVQQWLDKVHHTPTQSSSEVAESGQQRQQDLRQQQLDWLGARVWANYALALVKVFKQSQKTRQWQQAKTAAAQVHETVLQTMDMYHGHAWGRYAASWQATQAHQQHQEQGMAASTPDESKQWLIEQQGMAQHLWRQQLNKKDQLSWGDEDAAAVVPQQVASTAGYQERQTCHHALQGALNVAAAQQDEAGMQQLLHLGSLLKLMPRIAGFEAMLQLKLKRGAPPEALEELLGEMMGWGIIPSPWAYETLMEAYAAHMEPGPAQAVLDRMQAVGHHPVLRTYNRLLHGISLNGDLSAAMRVYNRMKLQGLQPDLQTMRCLFKCVRMYANNVRVATARALALDKAGDRQILMQRMSERAGLFATAYSQLAMWQRDMVAAGLKHTSITMNHLTQALERLGAVQDCLQLAQLSEDSRPGEPIAHRAALRVAGRTRSVMAAGEASKLLAHLAQNDGLTRQDYLAMISSQFWLKQDHEQLLQTVAEMQAAGFSLNENTLQQLLNVYCQNGMWGEALQVLNDVAAGRFSTPSSSASSSSTLQSSRGARRQGEGQAGEGSIDNDKLWHVVMRKLWEKRASDELLNDFLRHMAPTQLQRFKLMYGLHAIPGERGRYTLKPLEDWQLPLQHQQQQLQQAPPDEQQQLIDGGEGLEAGDTQQAHIEPNLTEQLHKLQEQGQEHPVISAV